jgi:serine/threonine protein kinase
VAGDKLVGREIGRYLIEAPLGSGGFAVVYRAVDTVLERTVALKVVDPAAHRNPTIGRRFVQEGRAVASLDHPAVVPVYDAGEHDGVLWMAMRLVEGRSVDQALTAGRQFRPDEVVAVIERIGSALDHAHARGVVHRDVKPSNLLLESDDPHRAHLADFGIAATARSMGRYTTGALGTAAYMAPEQARPSEVGPPADLYSLGCVAYEMLTGGRPFPGDDYVALLYAHATHVVPPVGQPAVDAVLARALAKSPADRAPSGAALAQALRDALDVTGPMWPAPAPTHVTASVTEPAPTEVQRRDTATLAQPVPVGISPGDASAPQPPPLGDSAGDARTAPPPPPFGVSPGDAPAPSPPSSPPGATVERVGRRARRRLVAGSLALLVAAVAVTVVVLDRRSSPDQRVDDAAGISYELVGGWEVGPVEPPTTTLVGDGDRPVAVVTHGLATSADAIEALADADPSVCQTNPVAYSGIDGSDAAAVCTNPDGAEPATAVGAIAGDELWVITVAPGVGAGERDDFLASIRLS